MDRRVVILKFGAAITAGLAGCTSDGGVETGTTSTRTDTSETIPDMTSSTSTTSVEENQQQTENCPEPPASDTSISDLLPSDPLDSGVIAGSATSPVDAVAATDVGVGKYEDTDGTQYYMEVVRWRSEGVAAEAVNIYGALSELDLALFDGDIVPAEDVSDGQEATMQVAVARGVYTFSVFGPDTEAARQVLLGSSAISSDCL